MKLLFREKIFSTETRCHELNVDDSCKIVDVIKAFSEHISKEIDDELKSDYKRFSLSHQGKSLDIDKTLKDYGIEEEDSVIVVLNAEITVLIKEYVASGSGSGQNCSLAVGDWFTVEQIKKMFWEKVFRNKNNAKEFKANNYKFLIGGMSLEDENTLKDYEIEDRSTILSVSVLHGGCGHWIGIEK